MVREASLNGRPVVGCDVCGLAFTQRELAEKCQAWCETHPSCNLQIGRLAVGSLGSDIRE